MWSTRCKLLRRKSCFPTFQLSRLSRLFAAAFQDPKQKVAGCVGSEWQKMGRCPSVYLFLVADYLGTPINGNIYGNMHMFFSFFPTSTLLSDGS